MEIQQELIDTGIEAQRFKEYLHSDGYFLGLISRMKARHRENILNLKPYDTELFKILKTQLDTLDWYEQAMDADIAIGTMEAEKDTQKGGIL